MSRLHCFSWLEMNRLIFFQKCRPNSAQCLELSYSRERPSIHANVVSCIQNPGYLKAGKMHQKLVSTRALWNEFVVKKMLLLAVLFFASSSLQGFM